jgi:hypothetical protein
MNECTYGKQETKFDTKIGTVAAIDQGDQIG